jgi:hypothetical protein
MTMEVITMYENKREGTFRRVRMIRKRGYNEKMTVIKISDLRKRRRKTEQTLFVRNCR